MHARRSGRFKEGWSCRSPTIIARAHPACGPKTFQNLGLAHDMLVNPICCITFFLHCELSDDRNFQGGE